MRLRLAPVLAVVAATVVAVLLLTGGDDKHYQFRMHLDNALGLRDGSLVTVGGVEIGTVDVALDEDDQVSVTANLDPGKGPIGANAKAFVSSVNLLGQKRLELDKGDLAKPQPSGSLIPAGRVTPSTDLDQVLGALDANTRARLGVLLSEAGSAVFERKADVRQLLGGLPTTISEATELLDEVVADNHTLGELVDNSDRVIGTLTQRRTELVGLVDTAGGAAGTFAARRGELRATLAKAPGTLQTLQTFLGKLETTTIPLGPAARDIAAAAPEVNRTLAEVEPFTDAAEPTLERATDVAPSLTRLATGATPTLQRAVPTLRNVAGFADDLAPVSVMLTKSTDNLISVVDNWSHAVQFRDGLSHLFRGEAGFSPDTAESLLARFGSGNARKKDKSRGTGDAPKAPARPKLPDVAGTTPLPSLLQSTLGALDQTTQRLKGTVDETTGKVQGAADGVAGGLSPKDQQNVLDFLLKP